MFGLGKGDIRVPNKIDLLQVGAAALLAGWKLVTTYREYKGTSQEVDVHEAP